MRTDDSGDMNRSAQLVSEFASSLDTEDYPTTLSCLADDCVYDSPTGKLTGPTAIIDSYKGNGESARSRFDSIVYRHELIPLEENWYQITFIDEIRSGNRSHVFRCNQRVCIGQGKIVYIIHEETPEQREKLNAFVQSLDKQFEQR